MAQLPDLDKHLLGALSQLTGKSVTGALPARSIHTLIHTCIKKNEPKQNQ